MTRDHDDRQGPGPVETTVNFAEWARLTGYNPATRAYDLPPQDVEPAFVATRPDRTGVKYAVESKELIDARP